MKIIKSNQKIEKNEKELGGKSSILVNSNFESLNYLDLLPNGNIETTNEFFHKVFLLIIKFVEETMSRSHKILEFKHPDELKKKFDFEIYESPKNLNELLKDCDEVMKNCVKTGHPRFFNQLSQGLDLVSLVGEIITATTNTNMFTYEIAPVYNLMEESVLRSIRQIIGWQEPGDGILNPGGSISNLNAMEIALYSRYPNLKNTGLYNMPKLIAFTSAHSHYSIKKSAFILGLGIDQVKYVPVDSRGRMKSNKLKEMIEDSLKKNEVPFFVNVTEGTTVLGSFDPIKEVADLCQQYNLWLHADASWGGAALLSKTYKYLLNGIERVDSVTWNPHKMMSTIQNDSIFLLKKKKDKHYDTNYDTGDKAIQCGRRVDIFKLWLMWRAKGLNGFEAQIDNYFIMTHYLCEKLKKNDNFEMVLENPEFTNICFWYIPNSLKNLKKESEEYNALLNKVAPKIKEKMMHEGRLMISYQPLDEKPNFFRMIISNPATKLEDIDFIIQEIERLGKNL